MCIVAVNFVEKNLFLIVRLNVSLNIARIGVLGTRGGVYVCAHGVNVNIKL